MMNDLYLKMLVKMQGFSRDEQGQDLIEYGLLAALVAVVAMASVRSIGTKISSVFNSVTTAI